MNRKQKENQLSDQTVKALIIGGVVLALFSICVGEVLSIYQFGLKNETVGHAVTTLRAMAISSFLCVLASVLVANKLTESGKWRIYVYIAMVICAICALLMISLDPPV